MFASLGEGDDGGERSGTLGQFDGFPYTKVRDASGFSNYVFGAGLQGVILNFDC